MKICAITGSSGYLGSRIKAFVQQRGWKVSNLNRRSEAAGGLVFRLGDDVSPALLQGATALVHCAYDFKQHGWANIHEINVTGSEKLFRAAQETGVQRLVYISSISAYEGCRSLYGRAKLETERIALSFGATVIRPGLIWGDPPGAMFGKLVEQVQHAGMLPLIGGGRQIQYLVHQDDLAEFIHRCINAEISAPAEPVTIAHEQPWTFRQILEEIARAQKKRVTYVPVPWRFVWAALKLAELGHVPLNFRSDSLVSLMYQNPNPGFAPQRQLGVFTRPFTLTNGKG